MDQSKNALQQNTAGEGSVIPSTPIRFIFSISRPHKWFAIFAFLAATFAQSLMSFASYILKIMVDTALHAGDSATQAHNLLWWGIVYVSTLGCSFVFWRLSGFIGMEWVTRAQMTAYKRLYEHLSLHSHTYFSDRFAGSLSHKVSHAADGAERLMDNTLWGYYTNITSLVITIGLLTSVHPLIGLMFAGLIVAIVILNIFLVRHRKPHVVAYAESSSRLRGVSVDTLNNVSAMRQYARRDYELERLDVQVEDRRAKDLKQWRISEWGLFANNVLIVAVLAVIVIVAVGQLARGAVTVGEIVLIITLVFQTSGTLVFIGNSMGGAVRIYGEIEDGLTEVLLPHEILDAEGATELSVRKGEIAFHDVSFAYENQDVFNSLELTVAPGERVGLVGGSGAGKTTLVSLLLRQHDIQQGVIAIDGQNIAEVTQDSLRGAVALVPQDPQLFHRTIRENIMYGKLDATSEEVMHAAKAAYADEFIETLPQSYDTMVGERGVKLSGGQRQRVVIARAILKNAPILVLDEATSALDSASEVVIQKALHTLMEGKTVIAIAHRLSTLREMDRIVVLHEGKVAESGTHDELVAHGGIYANLWGHQIGGFLPD